MRNSEQIPKWGYYVIGCVLLILILLIGGIKVKSEIRKYYVRQEITQNAVYKKKQEQVETLKQELIRTSKLEKERVKNIPKIKTREEVLRVGFSVWDGSHYALEKYIKSIIRDPKSYEHINTRYSDNGDHIIVGTTFRSKNGFGGMVIGNIAAKASIDGKILEVIIRDF